MNGQLYERTGHLEYSSPQFPAACAAPHCCATVILAVFVPGVEKNFITSHNTEKQIWISNGNGDFKYLIEL